jgi:cell division protein FtsN
VDRAVKKWELLSLFVLFLSACTLSEQTGKGVPSSGLIITPPSYYSTQKAKALGERYKQHLERLVQELVEHPLTGKLQFANNIASVGGIGFFTHSASRSPDERYLEVVLGVPEVFDHTVDLNSKVNQLFSLYGFELLSILTGDADIYHDTDVAGYGLNFSWRATSEVSGRRRVALERAVIYISKQETRRFLDQRDSHSLLEASVIFAVGADGLPRQFAYGRPEVGQEQPTVSRVELDPNILEQDLSPERQPEVPPAQDVPEKASPGKSPRHAVQGEQSITDKTSTEKATPEPERTPEPPKEVAKRATELPKEAVKKPSPPLEIAKRTVPPEEEAPAKLGLKEEIPGAVEEKLPEPQLLQGYLVQVLFPKGAEAERWSELLMREGYSTAMSTIRGNQLVRLRVGAFSTQAEAGRLLAKLQAQGLVGMVLYHVPRGHSLPAESQAGNKPGVVSPEETVVEGTKVGEEERVEQPKTGREDEGAIVSRAVEKEPLEVKRPEPRAAIKVPEKKKQAEEKTEPKVVLKKKVPVAIEEKRRAGELPKRRAIPGYFVQVSFLDTEEAQRWSELLTQEGYTTSMTRIRGNQSVRLRVGAFPSSGQAQSLLKKLQKEGLKGFIVQAPK